MLIYALRRALSSLPTLLILLTLTFFLMRFAPGGPFDSDRAWPPEIEANINHLYELDQPVYVQYGHWLRDLAHGDLRESFQYLGRPVSEMLAESFPTSFALGGLALFFSIAAGIPLGIFAASGAARKPGSWMDISATFVAISGVSLPSYLVASLLILVFSFWLGWLPPALWEGPSSMILPVLTLGLRPMAIIARLTRASMVEALRADYIRTAYGKGLSSRAVLYKHALKNSAIPIATSLGTIAANLLTGSFLVELVFQIPGAGKYFVQAVINRDYPLVMGVTLIYGVILMASNLTSELLCAWADPRIRLE